MPLDRGNEGILHTIRCTVKTAPLSPPQSTGLRRVQTWQPSPEPANLSEVSSVSLTVNCKIFYQERETNTRNIHEEIPATMAEENANVVGATEDEEVVQGGPNLKLELNVFRAQWMSELNPEVTETGKTSSRAAELRMAQEAACERKARELFLKAVEEEQNGAVYEAIKFYRRAMQLVPDIEFKINYNRVEKELGDGYLAENADGVIEDLLAYFNQQLTLEDAWPKICQPDTRTSQMHISALPPEVLMLIFRWVVSSDLDMRTLEQLSLVCRGFYICARDSDLWRCACLRVWGRTHLAPYKSWREMFLERPRVRFDGVYISKVSYVRQGEESLDGFYRNWHHVTYYRYLRFFPEGKVVMLTTPDEPMAVVSRLRSRNTRGESVMLGFYRLSQETDNQTKVFVVVSKRKEEKGGAEVQRNRFCRRNPAPEAEHSFHVGLKMPSGGRQVSNKLTWIHHSCHITYRPSGETVVTVFDLDNMYAPFFFARVKSYTAVSEGPL